MEPETKVAEQFGNLIAAGDYSAAHALLTQPAQEIHSPDKFRQAVDEMTAYAPGPIQTVVVMEDFILTDWPDKRAEDIAVVYVSLEGDGFCEAVTVTTAHEAGNIRIRDLEWGRP